MDTTRSFEVESPSIPTAQSSWKDRAIEMVGSMRDVVNDKLAMIRPKVDQTMATVKPRVTDTWQRLTTKADEVRRNPAVLGGVAAAAGLALGLAGRWMRHRAHAPTLVIVEV